MSSPVFVETSPITGEFIELQSLIVKDVNGNKEFLTSGFNVYGGEGRLLDYFNGIFQMGRSAIVHVKS